MGYSAKVADVLIDYYGAVVVSRTPEFKLSELGAVAAVGHSEKRLVYRDRFRRVLQRPGISIEPMRRALLETARREGVNAILIEVDPVVDIVVKDEKIIPGPEGSAGRDLVSLAAVGDGTRIPLNWICVEHPPPDHLDISDADRGGVLELIDELIADVEEISFEGGLPPLFCSPGEFGLGEDEVLRDGLGKRGMEYVFGLSADYTRVEVLAHPFESPEPDRTLAELLDPEDPDRAVREATGSGPAGEFAIARPDGSFAIARPELGLDAGSISGHRPRERAAELGSRRAPTHSLSHELRARGLQGATPGSVRRHAFVISILTLMSEKRLVTGGEAPT
ncbi:MAG TPA: hypothetical protein VLI94_05600 [Solirubrobacterales bacterium]|nr:hypothetical protein [Solirubrobacterales bacterium]